jgi:hypothetical protein
VKIDLSNVEPAEEKTSLKVSKEFNLVKEALLGYAQMDILDNMLEFGKWNVRPVNAAEVKKIVEGMKTGI